MQSAVKISALASFLPGKPFWRLCVIALLLCSLVGLLFPKHFFFDLFNHFRPQAVLGGVFLLWVTYLLKDRTFFFLALFIIVLNVALMVFRLQAFSPQAPAALSGETAPPRKIKIMSANVLTSNNDTQRIINLVREHNPEVFVALETDEKWRQALQALAIEYPFQATETRPDNFGMAVYAKEHFKSEILSVKAYDHHLPMIKADFGSFVVVAMHPPPPLSHMMHTINDSYIKKAVGAVENDARPVFLVGDFNSTPWSGLVDSLAVNGFSLSGKGLTWTWPVGFFPLAINIDHVFYRNATVSDHRALEDIGSDHFPVMVSAAFQ